MTYRHVYKTILLWFAFCLKCRHHAHFTWKVSVAFATPFPSSLLLCAALDVLDVFSLFTHGVCNEFDDGLGDHVNSFDVRSLNAKIDDFGIDTAWEDLKN